MLFSSLSSKLVVEEFTIQVTRKPIKSLRLSIQPNTGKIRMSAPLRTFDTTIRSFVISRLDWIRKHISRIDHHNLQVLEYRTGEVHLFEGRGYELDFEISTARSTARSASACIQDEKIVLACPSDATTLHKHKLLTRWYKNELERRVPELIYRWESVLGVQVYSWSTRQMKTRW